MSAEPASLAPDGSLPGRLARLLYFPAFVMVLWIVLARWMPDAVAAPSDAYAAIRHGVERGWMKTALATTMTATFLSFAITTVLGLGLSIALALSKFWGDVFDPILVWLYSVPKIVLYPIVLMLFGISLSTSVAFGVLNSVLPVAFIVIGAIRAVPVIHLKVARSYRLTRWQSFVEIIVPVALPSIVTAARYAFSLSFLAVVVAEMLGSRQGLGQELFKAVALNQVDRIFGVTTVLTVIAIVVNGVFLFLQYRLTASRHRSAGLVETLSPARI